MQIYSLEMYLHYSPDGKQIFYAVGPNNKEVWAASLPVSVEDDSISLFFRNFPTDYQTWTADIDKQISTMESYTDITDPYIAFGTARKEDMTYEENVNSLGVFVCEFIGRQLKSAMEMNACITMEDIAMAMMRFMHGEKCKCLAARKRQGPMGLTLDYGTTC